MGFLNSLDTLKFQKSQSIPAFLLILIACIYFYHDTIDLYPSFIHAWTQSDRLAIALNFQQNGFDLFHPATFNLLTKHGITQVDFPIHDYMVALLSSLLNLDAVLVFRMYNLLYSLLGIYFIFKLTLLFTKSFWRSFLIAFFVFSLPFYTYYQAGFLPSVPSFANLFIAFYFFFKYLQDQKIKDWYLSSAFILLAVLSRLPLLIFLVALSAERAFCWWKNRKIHYKEIIPLTLSFGIILLYFLYNRHLANTYGSMFLQFFLPITSIEHLYFVVASTLERWSGLLFGTYHAVFLLLSLLSGILFLLKRTQFHKLHISMILLLLLSAFAVLLFFLVMAVQFIDHDYYLIDTVLPLIVLLLILCFTLIKINDSYLVPFLVISSFFVFFFITESKAIQEKRYNIPFDDQIHFSVQAYQKTAAKLDEWGVKEQDTLLILNASSTNIPFTIWNRRGYTLLNTSKDSIQKYLTKNFQHVVLLDSFRLDNILANYPGIIYELDREHAAHGLAVYSKSQNASQVGFFENFIDAQTFDFEKDLESNNYLSSNLRTSSLTDYLGKSLEIGPEDEYSFTYKRSLDSLHADKSVEVFVMADFLNSEDSSGVALICQFGGYYAGRYFSVELDKSDKWQKKYFHFIIPAEDVQDQKEFALYFWNPGMSSLRVDNYTFIIYQ